MPDTGKAPSAAGEALRQLGADANAIAGGQVTIRDYMTAEEHALLLAARELASAQQANTAAGDAERAAVAAAEAAMDELTRVRSRYETALAAVVNPAPQTGEGDCS